MCGGRGPLRAPPVALFEKAVRKDCLFSCAHCFSIFMRASDEALFLVFRAVPFRNPGRRFLFGRNVKPCPALSLLINIG